MIRHLPARQTARKSENINDSCEISGISEEKSCLKVYFGHLPQRNDGEAKLLGKQCVF